MRNIDTIREQCPNSCRRGESRPGNGLRRRRALFNRSAARGDGRRSNSPDRDGKGGYSEQKPRHGDRRTDSQGGEHIAGVMLATEHAQRGDERAQRDHGGGDKGQGEYVDDGKGDGCG